MPMTVLDRGFDRWALLLPGWATSSLIFSQLDLPANYMIWDAVLDLCDGDEFMSRLSAEVAARSLPSPEWAVGFSLGGLLLAQLLSHHDMGVSRLLVLGLRPAYPAADLKWSRKGLRSDETAFLTQFYEACLMGSDVDGATRDAWLVSAREYWTSDRLLMGLDVLAQTPFDPTTLPASLQLTVCHGESDVIAPISEMVDLLASLDLSLHRCLGKGHVCWPGLMPLV